MKIREKLGKYQEVYYMVFLLAMTGMTSAGINSEYGIYKVVFALVTVLLLLKMAVTNYSPREIFLMAVFAILLGMNLLRNGEKTLILTAIGIFGAKNVSLDKVLKYALWLKTVITIATLTLAATGVIENEMIVLPKNWEQVELYCYGYYSPNMAFANIFVLLLLAILVYGDRLKWYAYVIGTAVMLAAYKLFMCRTGLAVWLVLCLMILGYKLTKYLKWEKIYMALFTAIPAVLAALTLVLPIGVRMGWVLVEKADFYLTGRIHRLDQYFDNIGSLFSGNVPREPFDSVYFHLLYNYGGILFVLWLIAYCAGMWYCTRKGSYYGTIGLGVMATYGFMEQLPLSVSWNLPLLYLSWILFKERKVADERLQ